MPQTISPPHQSMPQTILPPHWSMPQAILPPHWSMPQAILPPHWSMPQAILPPHWSIPQTISPPHWNMPQAISPPHWSMPQAILPPHWSMAPAISPPHWSMPPAILPPHWSMPPAILPPHQRSWLVSNWTVNCNHIGVPKTNQTLSQANCIFQNSSHICKPFSSQIYKKINPHTHSMKKQHHAVLLACKTRAKKSFGRPTSHANQSLLCYINHIIVSAMANVPICQLYSREIITNSSLKAPRTALY